MDPDFWLQRWQENKIGFHLDEVNPLLITHFPRLQIAPPARVFVPMCGKSVDLVWLRAQGYEVEAVEISPVAIEAFFREQELDAETQTVDGLTRWQVDGLGIWCADFFDLNKSHIGDIAVTYDRAALIAMPEARRPEYARKLLDLTASAPQLLITLDYPQSQMSGPPFAVPHAEVVRFYGATYPGLVKPQESVDILASHERFAARGLTSLYENVYLLQVPKK
jgi:thiopurine S-methyltransferase